MLLYVVSGHHLKDGQVGLLPGVLFSDVQNDRIGKLRQGAAITIKTPSGLTHATEIATYYVIVTELEGRLISDASPRIIIALPTGLNSDQIPIGSEVHLSPV